MTIAVRTSIGDRQDRITLDAAQPPVSDGDGGSTVSYTPLNPPQMWGQVSRATQAQLERLAGVNSTVLATATHLVRVPFHPTATTQVRISWTDRAGRAHVANVTGVGDLPDLNETVLVCEEVVP